MSVLRPLPPRPSLEFEHKEAKALLRQLRTGDPDALARARERHPTIGRETPDRFRLADAQLVIAREYGFASWPKLVRYFEDAERQKDNYRSFPNWDRIEHYESSVQALLEGHRKRSLTRGARALVAYVPRLYGVRVDDVYSSPLSEDEARLAIARQSGFPSWEALAEWAKSETEYGRGEWQVNAGRLAGEAMAAADLAALQRVVAAHPRLLHPSPVMVEKGGSLLRFAIHHERRLGREAMRPILEWLATQGLDLQRELNRQLCGHRLIRTDKVRWLLERGADPNWIAPNGVSVLEHAIIRYWNAEAVDLVAARSKPPKALWIAAGLGDLEGVRDFLDPSGKPTPAARTRRPPFDAVGPHTMSAHPEADDEEILMEAAFVAVLNERTNVLEYLVRRGFDVNSLVYDLPLIGMAVGNAMTAVVECLIRCGADLDLRGRYNPTAREGARELFENSPEAPGRRRIVELCGMDPDAILAERDARPAKPAALVGEEITKVLELARDDAAALGQTDVRPENLLFGLLRARRAPLMLFTQFSGIDVERFHSDMRGRLERNAKAMASELPMDSTAETALRAAVEAATARRRETVEGNHLLLALLQDESGPLASILARYGGSAAKLSSILKRGT